MRLRTPRWSAAIACCAALAGCGAGNPEGHREGLTGPLDIGFARATSGLIWQGERDWTLGAHYLRNVGQRPLTITGIALREANGFALGGAKVWPIAVRDVNGERVWTQIGDRRGWPPREISSSTSKVPDAVGFTVPPGEGRYNLLIHLTSTDGALATRSTYVTVEYTDGGSPQRAEGQLQFEVTTDPGRATLSRRSAGDGAGAIARAGSP